MSPAISQGGGGGKKQQWQEIIATVNDRDYRREQNSLGQLFKQSAGEAQDSLLAAMEVLWALTFILLKMKEQMSSAGFKRRW